MFDTNNISYNQISMQYVCSCNANSSKIAQEIQARYLMAIRQQFGFTTEIGIDGPIVTISSYKPDIIKYIANQINKEYFIPPLNVYIFYGNNKKGLESRWCVGFNFPYSKQLIDTLNSQNRFINADQNSQNWKDKNGNSYPIVILTGIMESEITEEITKLFNDRITICLNSIENSTSRKVKPLIIQ